MEPNRGSGRDTSTKGDSMEPLATSADVVARLGRDLTPVETIRVDALLVDASASVRSRAGQDFTQAETTDRLRVDRNGKVTLPQRPVTAVGAVVSLSGAEVAHAWPGFDQLVTGAGTTEAWTWQFEPFLNGVGAVDVTYTHGFETIPDDLVGVVCSIVLRAVGREPLDAGITSETIAGYSYALGVTGAAGAFGMLQPELDIVDRYARVGGRVNTAP